MRWWPMLVAMFLLKTVLVLGVVEFGCGNREHKVHNIVLYPERHSWCQTTAIKQVVASPGYEPTTIDNNVCVGACFSYSIPRTQPAEPGELIGPYCDSCQPAETKCYHVTLHADSKNNEGPKTIKKRVEIIMNCSCISCETVQNKDCELTDQNTAELPTDLFNILHPSLGGGGGVSGGEAAVSQEEVPDLIHLPQRNRSGLNLDEMNLTGEQNNEKLIKLLKSMEEQEGETNISYDKKLIRELLEILERNREELGKVDLMKFLSVVNLHNSENMQVDLSKLKEFLHVFKRNKHANLDLVQMGADNNEKITRDIEDLAKKYDLPLDFGVERHGGGLAYQKTSVEDNAISPHHHYVGEEQHVGSETGHLIAGPHGSLVLTPDTLQPNHAGLVISYENHPKSHKIVLDEDLDD